MRSTHYLTAVVLNIAVQRNVLSPENSLVSFFEFTNIMDIIYKYFFLGRAFDYYMHIWQTLYNLGTPRSSVG